MKSKWIWAIVGLGAVLGAFAYFKNGAAQADEIQYRYAPVEKGELVRSTTATGVLVAQTSIDVRSKAGGTIVKLAVDEGSIVEKGDLIAIIDPRDTKAIYDQAAADLQAANARISQAQVNHRLQIANSVTSVKDAQNALDQARIRLQKAKIEAARTPVSTNAAFKSAQAGYDAALKDLERFDLVTAPQSRRDIEGQARQARVAFETAKSDLERQRELLQKGYVAQSTVDRALSAHESARTAMETAEQRKSTLDAQLRVERESLIFARNRAQASLAQARAETSQNDTAAQNLREAYEAVEQAEISVQRARDSRLNNAARQADVSSAHAGALRSRIEMSDARVQLESTTVVAPRDGVVTLKYAEEGTVIPPGVGQNTDRANIVQLSDVTQLFMDCTVDEADIAMIREGQRTRVVTEAFPGVTIDGTVVRVNPSAKTENSVTSVTVRVELHPKPDQKVRLLPGMNATCEFVTLAKPNVLILPSQALKNEGGKSYVLVKGPEGAKPVKKDVVVGEQGNTGVEVLSGLEAKDEVVVAEINLRELRDMERRMAEAQQGGGLAGGTGPRGPSRMGGGTAGGSGGGMSGGGRGGMGGGTGGR